MIKQLIYYAILSYTVVLPAVAVYLDNIRGAIVLGVLGVVCLVLTRIEDIHRLKLWGMQAELREQIDRASATIDQLRELAAALAEPIMCELALHGMIFQELTFASRCEMKNRIHRTLSNIGVAEQEIKHISRLWDSLVRHGFAGLIFRDLYHKRQDLQDEISRARLPGGEPGKPEEYRKFIKRHEIEDEEIESRINDYEHYLRTGEVRRAELWPVGWQPFELRRD